MYRQNNSNHLVSLFSDLSEKKTLPEIQAFSQTVKCMVGQHKSKQRCSEKTTEKSYKYRVFLKILRFFTFSPFS